jgi:hypothetical protein
MACLVGGITLRQVGPRSARPEHPQNTVQYGSTRFPRPSTAILSSFRFWNERIENCPLGVAQISWCVPHICFYSFPPARPPSSAQLTLRQTERGVSQTPAVGLTGTFQDAGSVLALRRFVFFPTCRIGSSTPGTSRHGACCFLTLIPSGGSDPSRREVEPTPRLEAPPAVVAPPYACPVKVCSTVCMLLLSSLDGTSELGDTGGGNAGEHIPWQASPSR